MNDIIYGIHAIQTLLKQDYLRFKKVYIIEKHKNRRLLSIIDQLKSFGITIKSVNRQWINKQTKNAVHQGIVAYIKANQQYKESDLYNIVSQLKSSFLLILENITDPHNLGACLRSAEAAGVNAIIVSKNNSAKLNAIAKKVACGATENITIIKVTNIVRTICQLQQQGIWIIGASDRARRTLYDVKLTGSIALVIGSEDKGIRRLTMECCDELISIPMSGIVSSLNVSVATGVCLFEAVRQRRSY